MAHRYASAPRERMENGAALQQLPHRSMTPNRYGRPAPSNGLIRLSLKKPMGIVFEPMYDPQQQQRGVRICDLPRTGAAALSRQLEVGDELLSINDTTVSRLGFDEIMDFIIEADPESVQLLFRRPRKEARSNIVKEASPKIKWVDDNDTQSRSRKEKKSRRKKKEPLPEDETTLGTLTEGEESYAKSRSSRRGRKNPYESESFLDLLIDTICTNSNVCRDTFRRADSFSDEDTLDDGTLGSDRDESTYVTYEESVDRPTRRKEKPVPMEKKRSPRQRSPSPQPKPEIQAPAVEAPIPVTTLPSPVAPSNPAAPIQEVEYDERMDHGADVSVMDSLGGPSLLIERKKPMVPTDLIEGFGLDYPNQFGMSRVETIQADPLKFYTYVVKSLLEEHEPEKVRLLDKLLAKYKGREDHLVQKLSVRYQAEEKQDMEEFVQTVQATKNGLTAQTNISTAKHRLDEQGESWPKEEKKDEFIQDDIPEGDEEEDDEEEEDEESENDPEDVDDDDDESYDQVDGTSPAVIAQVSELLNYVYGKTSVPGQIDRVSTIMRAYEGREAVLLELLETKALIKANKEKENADPLPSFLRQPTDHEGTWDTEKKDMPPVTPMANPPLTTPSTTNATNTILQDDISSMSGVSSPAADPPSPRDEVEVRHEAFQKVEISPKRSSPAKQATKKKKGLFGGLFKKKGAATPNRTTKKNHRKLKGVTSGEGSI